MPLFLLLISNTLCGQSNYLNEPFGVAATVPEDWHIYAELRNDTVNKRAIISWGIPAVYSEVEKASIENAISISAYKIPEIKNIDDLRQFEFERVQNILQSKELVDSSENRLTYVSKTKINGLIYRTKKVLFYKNKASYVIAFTATPGTYPINLHKFDNFIPQIKFFEPTIIPKSLGAIKLKFNGLYMVKSGSKSVSGKKVEEYTYLKFFDNGTAKLQKESTNTPETIAKLLKNDSLFKIKGQYILSGHDLNITFADPFIPGIVAQSDLFYYTGQITDENKLYLDLIYGNFNKVFWFEFVGN